MTEQRRPVQPTVFVFPDEDANPAYSVIDPILRGQPGSSSTRDRSAAGAHTDSVQPSLTPGAAGMKAGPALNKSTAVLEIQGLKERVTQLEEENETLKGSISKIEREAKKEKHRLAEELITIRGLIETIQQESKARSDVMEVDSSDEGSDSKEMVLDAETTLKLEKSDDAAKSNVFLALLRQVFADGMGCPNKLTGDVLPAYPTDDVQWPMITRAGVDVKALRFHWGKTYSESTNWKGLQWVMKEIRNNGPQYLPAAAQEVADISNEDLRARVIWKFGELVKTYKNGKKLKQAVVVPVVVISSSPEAEGAVGAVVDDGPGQAPTVVGPKELSSGMKLSRAKGKFDVHLRKRNNLAKDHELRDKKFDAAMVHTLMSEDEDSVKDGQVIKTEFTSRPPVYRSDEVHNELSYERTRKLTVLKLQQFYDLLDKLPDPMPSQKYIKRVVGEPKDIPPPNAKKLENQARRWMISPVWLAKPENKAFDTPMRISSSGVAWGDEKDPEEIEATQQRVKEEKADIKRQKMGGSSKEKGKTGKGKGKGKKKAVSKQPIASSPSWVENSDDMYV